MTIHVEREQLAAAHSAAREQLLALRAHDHWKGHLSSSPLCTAVTVSALVLSQRHIDDTPENANSQENSWHSGILIRSELSELLSNSLRWLARQQNEDGGWGDAVGGRSTLIATLMVKTAFHLTGVPAKYADLLHRADRFVQAQGGIPSLKTFIGNDKSFWAAVLAIMAIAGLSSWRKVPSLPWGVACLPRGISRWLGLKSFTSSLPLIISVAQAKRDNCPSFNPLVRWLRRKMEKPANQALASAQAPDGIFSGSTLHTSFVIACIASQGQTDSPVVRKAVNALLSEMRSDGSWALCPEMTVSNTVRAVRALDWHLGDKPAGEVGDPPPAALATLDWLLAVQIPEHPPRHGPRSGWASTTGQGASANTIDTAGALHNLAIWRNRWPRSRTAEITRAALDGVRWLLASQNRDGGWPLDCNGSGTSFSKVSATDTTCQAMLALDAWKKILRRSAASHPLIQRIQRCLLRGLNFLYSQQRAEGSWWPLWSGSESHPQGVNPVIGTAQVLQVFSEMQVGQTARAQRAVRWLTEVQFPSGCWSAFCIPESKAPLHKKVVECENHSLGTIEETAQAIEALVPFIGMDPQVRNCVDEGVTWLIDSISAVPPLEPALVAFYPPKLWYHDTLLAPCVAASALGAVCRLHEVKSVEFDAVHLR